MKKQVLQILCGGGGMTVSEGYTPAWEGLFSRIEQPALIIQNGSIIYNKAAGKLLCGMEPVLEECMLPEALETYRNFDGQGSLLLNMRLGGTECKFTVCRENGADVFLASTISSEETYYILERTAEKIRRAAHEIYDAQNARLPELKPYDDPAVKESVSRINRTVCRLTRLSDNLADYGALRANQRQGQFEKIDLADNFRTLCNRMQDMFREYKIVFVSEDKTMMGQVDVSLMERAVLNLMTNALGSMQPGGTLKLQLLRLERGRAALRVQDDGEGIDLSSVSDALFATRQPISLDPSIGVGLGLSLCMEIARLHGGTLILQSAPGKGTSAMLSFSLSLPDVVKNNTLRFSVGGLDPFLVELSELLPASPYFDI